MVPLLQEHRAQPSEGVRTKTVAFKSPPNDDRNDAGVYLDEGDVPGIIIFSITRYGGSSYQL